MGGNDEDSWSYKLTAWHVEANAFSDQTLCPMRPEGGEAKLCLKVIACCAILHNLCLKDGRISATDVIKHVSPQALPSVYLQLLDSVYGSVEDGDELLAKLMGILQNNEEKPSDYLNRLQVALSAVVRRGGITESERNRYLLKQFCRGCWNDALIADLQLERKMNALPSFAELVLLIRTEEDKQANTGSQVTTIPLSFFQTHLSHHSLKSLDDLLDVELQIEGANGEAVPYLGYVELNLTFPEEFLGEETEVPTLVLVVPDVSSVPQILVGTNSLDVLYSNYVERHDCRPQSFLPGYSVVLNILEVRQRQASTGVLGLIKAHSKTPEVVPAGSTVVVEGQVHMSGAHQEKWAVVEAASASSLPGGLLVVAPCAPYLSSAPAQCQSC
ncbi:hypothetical protein D5F01_LYC15159 [Larimichthys crocea]|uniref:Paraneoplastic antigen Ma-like C-terminal domain-containing protein n=1 Tax=Larimichthys crocea TaxID=215358 RepID=A0A6G0I6X6_LARCR|nr:hypothetical protein D5F01_LYC15159 [Larimichthys crocea]